MKKGIIFLTIAVLFITSANIDNVKANGSIGRYAKEFIYFLVCEEDTECIKESKVNIHKEQIYDIFLNNIGDIYSYEVNGEEGYVILRRIRNDDQWEFEVIEASENTRSPFTNKNNKNIYISFGNYFEYENGKLINSLDNSIIDYQTLIDFYNDSYYFGAMGEPTYVTDTTDYTYYSKSTSYSETDGGFPTLSTDLNSSVDNNCSPTAGTEIVMYWDRYNTNLISSFTPTTITLVGYPPYSYYYLYEYKNWDNLSTLEISILEDLHDSLYDDMYTNNWYLALFGDMDGTYPVFFYDALDDYFASKNLDLEYNSLILSPFWGVNSSGEQLNWEEYTTEIDLDYPVIMQLGVDLSMDYVLYQNNPDIDYNDYYFYTYYGQKIWYDRITWTYTEFSNSAHTVVGYGYEEIDYYRINFYGNLYLAKTEKYFVVANGWGGTSLIKSDNSDISIAYSLYVD